MRPPDIAGNLTDVYDISIFRRALVQSPRRQSCANLLVVIFAAAAPPYRFWPRHSRAKKDRGRYLPMLDLGNSFRASVERDPDALAIVDGSVRLTYAQWYRCISAMVAGFDDHGLMPGDHLVTLLQNRWEAATIHWACQFAGIIITPVNWRAKAAEIDYCVENSEAKAVIFEEVTAEALR